MKPGPKTLFLLCGEPSGEAYAARVAREFRRRHPGVPMEGIGGARLADEGVKLLLDYGAISVVGVTEVLTHLPAIRSALAAATGRVLRPDIGAVVLVDYPDFNFRVGLSAWRRGVPVIYYIPPQVWAWRTGRAKTLAKFTRGAVVLFPFEETLLRKFGVNAVFAGHPLLEELEPFLDADPDPARFGLPEGKTIVGLLPGSRPGEIEAHLPVLLSAAGAVAREHPEVHFALPVARPALREPIARRVSGTTLPLTVVDEGRHLLFRGMMAAMAVSGTVTLELALLGVPSVIVYRTSWVTYQIGRRLAKVESVGLPNIVAGEPFLPELIQDDCTPGRIAAALGGMLSDGPRRLGLRARCLSLRDRLRGPGPTGAVVDMLDREAAGAWV
ncbi:MAG: lipid-A-disaccharide synthase [Deltaproteobacteria bacterium]|nr:MAG: lipid-A-disaccharide synthase [Deltaproteobacteria bacterium]